MKAADGKGPRIYSDDLKMKVCNCPIHQGKAIPLDQFWKFKTGKRVGKPLSRCIAGEKLQSGYDPGRSGFVLYSRVRFIFRELESRIGRAETCRRAEISPNFWWRHHNENGLLKPYVRKETAIRAMTLLVELRANNVTRHKKSIRHGAAARGRKERIPMYSRPTDFNGRSNDQEAEYRRSRRSAA